MSAAGGGGGCLTPSCFVVNLCAVMVGADFYVLPAAFHEIGRDLAATPAQLGVISLAVGVSSSLAGLFAGALAGSYSRTRLIGAGCVLWGATAALMGLCQTYVRPRPILRPRLKKGRS